MKTVWIEGLKGEDAKRMKENVLGSKKVLDKLIEICYTNIKSGERTKLEDFENPSWSHRAAFLAGEASAFRKIIDILTVDDERT